MSRTIKHEYSTTLFSSGKSDSHKSLSQEWKGVDKGGYTVARTRGLIDRRDYKSDRMKGIRHEMNGIRRANLKQELQNILKEEL